MPIEKRAHIPEMYFDQFQCCREETFGVCYPSIERVHEYIEVLHDQLPNIQYDLHKYAMMIGALTG